MTGVVVDITMSLDGFVTAPGADADHGLGVDGEALHEWAFSEGPDREVLDAAMRRTGAVVMGRRTFDIVDRVWTDELGYGAHAEGPPPPCFVVTHTQPDEIRLADQMTIVTGGLEAAIDAARAAAGDRDVVVMGGGDVAGQVLAAGLADELVLHVAPIVLGGGTPLFTAGPRSDLDLVASVVTPHAAHLTYAVR